MIITLLELRATGKFDDISDDVLLRKLAAIESAIRKFTNNNFQNERIRSELDSYEGILQGANAYMAVGDTVQISQSINNGLYVIDEISYEGDGYTVLDKPLHDDWNLVTKIHYPPDVKEGVFNMMIWEIEKRRSADIKSETLSRHSVTYFDNYANSAIGFPEYIISFLKPYMRAVI